MKNSVLISMMIACLTVSVSAVDTQDDMAFYRPGDGFYASHTQPSPVWLNYVGTAYASSAPLGTGTSLIIPLIGDVNGDGIDDIVLTYGDVSDLPNHRCLWVGGLSTKTGDVGAFSTATISTLDPSVAGGHFGGDALLVCLKRFLADVNGDGYADVVSYNNVGNWNAGLSDAGGLDAAVRWGPVQWGEVTDTAFCADFAGVGHADVCVWRPSTGQWLLRKTDPDFGWGQGAIVAGQFGLASDTALIGDINNDGRMDGLVVSDVDADGLLNWRAAYADANGMIDFHGGDPNWVTMTQFGVPGDTPFVADINGDGKADIGVIRSSNISGNKYWYVGFTTADGKLNPGIAEDDKALYAVNGDIPLIAQIGAPPAGVCVYQLEGDTNDDCVVNILDLKDFAGNWLISCVTTPGDPECIY